MVCANPFIFLNNTDHDLGDDDLCINDVLSDHQNQFLL